MLGVRSFQVHPILQPRSQPVTAADVQPTEYEEIEYSVADRVATIALNVPEKRNRLSYLLRRELVAALKEAERDDEVSLVLLKGNGSSFCAGYDLGPSRPPESGGDADATAKYRRARADGVVDSDEFRWTDQFARSCVRDWMTIWNLLKPVVAMVHGNCIAGGTEVMSMCDIVFVADDARIGYPPMRGMTTPDVPYFAWKLSMAHAKYLQITGNSVTGKEAAQMGWVAKSFPPEELEAQTMKEIRAMASVAPSLLSANKQSVNQAYEIQGMKQHFEQAWMFHILSAAVRPNSGEFGRLMQTEGLRAALAWRDGAFQAEGFI
jgi:enoyl-CoA hydratase